MRLIYFGYEVTVVIEESSIGHAILTLGSITPRHSRAIQIDLPNPN